MNWKDDQIEKLILFYSYKSLFLVPDFWYQKSCNRYQKLIPDSGTSFLVSLPVSGQYGMGINDQKTTDHEHQGHMIDGNFFITRLYKKSY